MSKSKNNVVDPVAIIESNGADTARWFVLSDSPPERDVEWTAAGADAAHRHIQRVWRLAREIAEAPEPARAAADESAEAQALLKTAHRAIRDVTDQIEGFAFNRALARLHEFTNAIAKSDPAAPGMTVTRRFAMRTMAQLMAPMAPHLAEEVWAELGGEGLVVSTPWPEADPALLVEDVITLPIQVNGKKRGEIAVPADADTAAVEALVLQDAAVQRALSGGTPRKLIVVPGRIVNVVV